MTSFIACAPARALGRATLGLLLVAAAHFPVGGQTASRDAGAELTALAKDVYLSRGPLGNSVVVFAPDDGWAIVGPQAAAQQPALRRELATRSPLPVRFVVITASRGLETNRDAGWSRAGAVVIAEEHAAYRMSQGLSAEFPAGTPPRSAPTTPSLGFSEVQQIHLGDEDIHVVHQKPGSSNADLSAHFEAAGVIYLGDSFIADGYPTVDEAHGGSYDGLVETAAKFMTWPARTRLVPGRGPVVTPVELRAYHDMLVDIRARVKALKRAGRSLEAIIAARPTASYDARWGAVDGSARALVVAAYHAMDAHKAP